MNKFWQFRNAAGGSAELLLYGEIADSAFWGDEVAPQEFKHDLDALGDVENITVRINSGGGSVWAAQAIGNVLEEHPATVTARIDGLCASAATIVACHCDRVSAAADTMYMIHPVRVGAGYSTADELETLAAAARKLTDEILDLYERKTGQSRDDLTAWMNETRWMKPDEAKEKGFIDEITGADKTATVENRGGLLFVNSINVGIPFDAAPKFLQDKAAPAAPEHTTPAGAPDNTTQEEGSNTMEIKTIDDARREIPDLVKQIEDNARAAARTDEQKRLQEIDEIARLYPADMVAAAKYGETACDAKELAWRGAQADAKKGKEYLDQRAADVTNSGVQNVGSVPPESQKPAAANSREEKATQGREDAQAYLNFMKGKVK